MIKCMRTQATDSQQLKKNCQRSFFRFLLVEAEAVEAEAEAEAIGVEAEAEAEAFEK